jgi:hypothetical protein
VTLVFLRVASLAISAYLASVANTLELQNCLLSDCRTLSDVTVDGYSSIWSMNFGPPPLTLCSVSITSLESVTD